MHSPTPRCARPASPCCAARCVSVVASTRACREGLNCSRRRSGFGMPRSTGLGSSASCASNSRRLCRGPRRRGVPPRRCRRRRSRPPTHPTLVPRNRTRTRTRHPGLAPRHPMSRPSPLALPCPGRPRACAPRRLRLRLRLRNLLAPAPPSAPSRPARLSLPLRPTGGTRPRLSRNAPSRSPPPRSLPSRPFLRLRGHSRALSGATRHRPSSHTPRRAPVCRRSSQRRPRLPRSRVARACRFCCSSPV
jgi:hypothetical protein